MTDNNHMKLQKETLIVAMGLTMKFKKSQKKKIKYSVILKRILF